MPDFVQMPQLSDTMTEGTLIRWLVKVGDKVDVGDPLAEVETDKATMEMVAFDEGTIGAIYMDEGTKAPVGETLAVIIEEGEEVPEKPASGDQSSPNDDSDSKESSIPEEPESKAGETNESTPTENSEGKRIKASPLAKKIAKSKGVDLNKIKGSGPGGRIVKKDLETADSTSSQAAPITPAPKPKQTLTQEDQRISLSGMRSIIAQRLLESKTQIPHFYLNIEINAQPLMDLRKQANSAAGEHDNKFTVNDFILKAVANAAASVPQVNASFDGDSIVQFGSVNLSVAIAVDDGLVTPVISGANKKSLLEISLAVKDLAERARSKKLSPDEFSGGTITVSNLGAYGIDNFDAIINPPQAAILSIGSIKNTPVVSDEGNIVPGLIMKVGMSCDHRVIDGAVGAEYLAELKKRIENPASMLI
ncbi:MAG: pyruvate dehydrogenase complex dihydrolipoamide acetyltransferase [Verrucomicrobiales bacterium]|nr:pyruvate dehydrogenase complex dihydrolipoamide acetyltransferase [Verrucomicrobiales bacterium]|tara:strand:+ start:1373 stop:2632 length:1260 start_codon:yes stop_codon:yes gene_type:complete